MKKVFLSVLLFLLSACESMDLSVAKKPLCSDRDWFELGRGDGLRGLPNLGWQKTSVSCESFNDDLHHQYLNGWYAGVDDFCTPGHGFTFGKSGHSYYDVCPKVREPGFLRAYKKGIRVFLVENSVRMITAEMRKLEMRLAKTQFEEEKSQLMLRLRDLQAQRLRNESEISKLEGEATSSKVL